MSYIYKTGRAELHDQIKKHAHFINGRVLDVGAGSYPRYKHLFKFDEYLSMDITPGERVDVVGEIGKIPFSANDFDSIICTQVLGDVFDLSQAFNELYRVLKPGGVTLITENLFDALHDEPRDFWRFTEHSLRRLAIDAGFKVEVLEKRGGYWSVRAQSDARYWIELLHANNRWFAPVISLQNKVIGRLARFMDKIDRSRANKLFTHGYILICSK